MRTHRQLQAIRLDGYRGMPWRALGLGLAALLIGAYGLFGNPLAASPGSGPAVVNRLVPDHLYGVDFVDGQTGFASGYYGTLLKTDNGGLHWTRLSSGVNQLLRRVDAVSEHLVWAVGHRGSILHSSDGGHRWQEQHRLPGVYLRDLSFVDSDVGWVVGHEAAIMHTRDGGRSWQRQELSGYSGRDLPRLNAVLALDRQRAVLAGEFGVLAITEDGGDNWRLVETPAKKTLTALAQAGGQVTAVGLDGIAWRLSFEHAPAVRSLSTATREHLFDIALDADGNGVVVGRSVLLRIERDRLTPVFADAGVELPYNWFHGVSVLPVGELLAVGGRGVVIKTAGIDEPFEILARLDDPATVHVSGPSPGER